MLKLRWMHYYDEMQISKRYIPRKQLLQKMKEISGEWPLLKVLIMNYPLFMSPIFYYHSSMIHLTITIGLILIWNTVFGFSLGSQLSHGWVLYFLCVCYLWSFSSSLLFSQGLQMPIFFFVSILRTEPKHLCVCKARTLPLSYISRQACCILLFVIFIPSWDVVCANGQFFFSQVFWIPCLLISLLGSIIVFCSLAPLFWNLMPSCFGFVIYCKESGFACISCLHTNTLCFYKERLPCILGGTDHAHYYEKLRGAMSSVSSLALG